MVVLGAKAVFRPPKVEGGRGGLMLSMPLGVFGWVDEDGVGAGVKVGVKVKVEVEVEVAGVLMRGASCSRSNTLSMYTERWEMGRREGER